MRYLVGPFNDEWVAMLLADVGAGLTVGLTLVPQGTAAPMHAASCPFGPHPLLPRWWTGLSYAGLANMPAVNGLYTAILPSATYLFFGSSMQLAVGPVAVVSLMMGSLMSKHQPDYATNTLGAVDTAAQASFNVGILMTIMGTHQPGHCLAPTVAQPHTTLLPAPRIRTVPTGILNLGNFINFISHPVMSGFTTGAAMSIGLSQVNNAFGFNGKTMYV
jgi:hypothetical protein